MQAGGAQVSFQARVPCLCAACAPPWSMSACKGEGISTGASVHTENLRFPPRSSVAKVTQELHVVSGLFYNHIAFLHKALPIDFSVAQCIPPSGNI